jgi:hypothetical protein
MLSAYRRAAGPLASADRICWTHPWCWRFVILSSLRIFIVRVVSVCANTSAKVQTLGRTGHSSCGTLRSVTCEQFVSHLASGEKSLKAGKISLLIQGLPPVNDVLRRLNHSSGREKEEDCPLLPTALLPAVPTALRVLAPCAIGPLLTLCP